MTRATGFYVVSLALLLICGGQGEAAKHRDQRRPTAPSGQTERRQSDKRHLRLSARPIRGKTDASTKLARKVTRDSIYYLITKPGNWAADLGGVIDHWGEWRMVQDTNNAYDHLETYARAFAAKHRDKKHRGTDKPANGQQADLQSVGRDHLLRLFAKNPYAAVVAARAAALAEESAVEIDPAAAKRRAIHVVGLEIFRSYRLGLKAAHLRGSPLSPTPIPFLGELELDEKLTAAIVSRIGKADREAIEARITTERHSSGKATDAEIAQRAIKSRIGQLVLQRKNYQAAVLVASANAGRPVLEANQAPSKIRHELAEKEIGQFARYHYGYRYEGKYKHGSGGTVTNRWLAELAHDLYWAHQEGKEGKEGFISLAATAEWAWGWSRGQFLETVARCLMDRRPLVALAMLRATKKLLEANVQEVTREQRKKAFNDAMAELRSEVARGATRRPSPNQFDALAAQLRETRGIDRDALRDKMADDFIFNRAGELSRLSFAAISLHPEPVGDGYGKVFKEDKVAPVATKRAAEDHHEPRHEDPDAKKPGKGTSSPPQPKKQISPVQTQTATGQAIAGLKHFGPYRHWLNGAAKKILNAPAKAPLGQPYVLQATADLHDDPNGSATGSHLAPQTSVWVLETSRRNPDWAMVLAAGNGPVSSGWIETSALKSKIQTKDQIIFTLKKDVDLFANPPKARVSVGKHPVVVNVLKSAIGWSKVSMQTSWSKVSMQTSRPKLPMIEGWVPDGALTHQNNRVELTQETYVFADRPTGMIGARFPSRIVDRNANFKNWVELDGRGWIEEKDLDL